MKLIITSLLISISVFNFAIAGQAVVTTINAYVPKDFSVADQYDADINQDGFNDKILVLTDKREGLPAQTEEGHRRLLVILLGTNEGFTKVFEADRVVYCKTCGGMMGDPYVRIAIKPPFFTVEHYGGSAWRWKRYTTFKYSKEQKIFFLHKDGHEFFHASLPNKIQKIIQTSKNFGRVEIQDFDIYKE